MSEHPTLFEAAVALIDDFKDRKGRVTKSKVQDLAEALMKGDEPKVETEVITVCSITSFYDTMPEVDHITVSDTSDNTYGSFGGHGRFSPGTGRTFHQALGQWLHLNQEKLHGKIIRVLDPGEGVLEFSARRCFACSAILKNGNDLRHTNGYVWANNQAEATGKYMIELNEDEELKDYDLVRAIMIKEVPLEHH